MTWLLSGWVLAAALLLLHGAGEVRRAQPSKTVARFHHVHYRVADPAAGMNAAAARTGGARVIVPGLGVGVRSGREYVLFDRLGPSDPDAVAQPSLADAYAAAAAWLAGHEIAVDPAQLSGVRMAGASPGERYHHIGFVVDDMTAVADGLRAAGAKAVLRSEDAVLFEAGPGVLVEIVRDLDREDAYWCPMHPDVRSADQGTCPACGMSLVPIPPPKIGGYAIDVTQVRDGQALAGLELAVREPGTGTLVTKFVELHEKTLHLFVVSRDLRYFAHVHPEQRPDGTFSLSHSLPAGRYMLIADFLPSGGTVQMVQKAIIVSGGRRRSEARDESNGLRVRLETEELAAGRHARLSFTVEEAASGQPVTDLEPYLGAPAHMLMVRSDLSDAVHAHPEELVSSGPAVSFHPIVPAAGDYRIWIQFQRAGRVSTHAFDVTVPR